MGAIRSQAGKGGGGKGGEEASQGGKGGGRKVGAPCVVHVCPDARWREADVVARRRGASENANNVIAGRVARNVPQDQRVLLGLDDGAHRVVVVKVDNLGLVQRATNEVPVLCDGQNLRRLQKGLEWNALHGRQVRLEVVIRVQAAALGKDAAEELLQLLLDFSDCGVGLGRGRRGRTKLENADTRQGATGGAAFSLSAVRRTINLGCLLSFLWGDLTLVGHLQVFKMKRRRERKN